ncbi:MAG: UTP--glucose-1-phosphate uridylyltransferase [Alphaproteobacteria bacterium CG_4_10_14_0_2_um_filter_63_37]|nr:MAG: UTP--glucose-1-phosphate uridylyltransferase [Alphaproteobacteria bacterium CG_4_10_14_0_2_um_filter_63_37]
MVTIPTIRKAVFPVGGLGTRFLPATKAIPKEMLPIVDKPLVQYAVEEAVAAGCDEIIFVTGRGKTALEDHFDRSLELEESLRRAAKEVLLTRATEMPPPGIRMVYTRQGEALGLGHAVLCAEALVGNEPFAVILADDFILSDRAGALAQMVSAYRGGALLAVQEVPDDEISRYGVIRPGGEVAGCIAVEAMVEKPPADQAPSNLGVVGRYILPPEIFQTLRTTPKGKGGEIQLTDAIAALIGRYPVGAFRFHGTRYDCGSKGGFLAANLRVGLDHPEVAKELSRVIRQSGTDRARLIQALESGS